MSNHWTENNFVRGNGRYRNYIRAARFTIDQFQPLLLDQRSTILVNGIPTSTGSKRLRVIARDGYRCYACGIQGTYVWQEAHARQGEIDLWHYVKTPPPLAVSCPFRMHLNVYASDPKQPGSSVMLTIDHVLPMVHGGTNSLTNLVCLCMNCNQKKGSDPYWLRDLPRNKLGFLIQRPQFQCTGREMHV